MEKEKTKLVEEKNTIYEIDLECLKKKKQEEEQRRKKNGNLVNK